MNGSGLLVLLLEVAAGCRAGRPSAGRSGVAAMRWCAHDQQPVSRWASDQQAEQQLHLLHGTCSSAGVSTLLVRVHMLGLCSFSFADVATCISAATYSANLDH